MVQVASGMTVSDVTVRGSERVKSGMELRKVVRF